MSVLVWPKVFPLVRSSESPPFPATDTSRRRLSTVATLQRVARVRACRSMTRLAANRDHLPETHPDHRARAWRCIARSNPRFLEARAAATETLRHSSPRKKLCGLQTRLLPGRGLFQRGFSANRCGQRRLPRELPRMETNGSAEES